MKEYAERFYSSNTWKACREQYRKSKRYLCERCLERGVIKPGEIVHHRIQITPDNIGIPEITLNPENLMLVCRDCHAELHGNKKRYKVDELGRVIIK